MRDLLALFLKFFGQAFFILQSIVLLIPVSLFRIIKRLINLNKTSTEHYNPFKATHEDVFRHKSEIIKVDGYRVEEFEFQTEDQAYVTFWRIFAEATDHTSQKSENKNRIPVVIQHGLLDCSMSWFHHSNKNNCLPYILAQSGYDVWIGNNRGTKYSKKNSENFNYWEYNLDHLIRYDLPCIINSITATSRTEKLVYIGHSQGTTQFLAAMDVHPYLHQKIQCFIGFGPVISLLGLQDHSLIRLMARIQLCEILKLLGFKALLIIPNWMSKLIGILIYNSWFYFHAFYYIVTGLCGRNSSQQKINLKRFGVIISHEPGGASINNVLHWIQMYRRGGILSKYDYGKKKNLQLYGSEESPPYTFDQLKNLPFNCHLFKGTSDRVISEENFKHLTNKFNEQNHFVYEVQDFAHLDYIWSENAKQAIYQRVLEIIDSESSKSQSKSEEQTFDD